MLLYVIRHGQTDWNAEARLQGQKDIPLNETGRAQASGNGEALAAVLGNAAAGFDFVSSPLSRTRETMERLRAAMGFEPAAYRMDDRLKELSFGDWEGFTLDEVEAAAPGSIAERKLSKWDFIPPGTDAESYEILSWRTGAWLSEIRVPTICVTHGGVIRSMFKIVGGMEPNEAAGANIPQDRILKIESGRIGWM